MMSPYFLFSFLIGSLYGVAFHLWQGKTLQDILYYLIAGVIGFSLGQIVAQLVGWQWYMLGPLHLVEASLMAWALLFLARWLRLS